jgi:hypothetical protein
MKKEIMKAKIKKEDIQDQDRGIENIDVGF